MSENALVGVSPKHKEVTYNTTNSYLSDGLELERLIIQEVTRLSDQAFASEIKRRILTKLAGDIGSIVSSSSPKKQGSIDRIVLKLPDEFVNSLTISEGFWEEKVKWVKNALESGEAPEPIPQFPNNPPDDFPWNEITWKEHWIVSQCTSKAASELLRQNISNIDFKSLKNLLWHRLDVGTASYRLSQLQKNILFKLVERTESSGGREVEWKASEWFGETTPSKQASYSRALERLESRGLVIRQSVSASNRDKSTKAIKRGSKKLTTHIKLTDLGLMIGKQLTVKLDGV